MRRVVLKMMLGFVLGAAVVLLLEPELREKLWKEIIKESQFVATKAKDLQEKISKAIEVGQEEAHRKEKELEGQVSFGKEESLKKKSPNYIV